MSKTVIAAALGECVHVAGITNFLRLAETAGWRTVFLGPAVPVEKILAAAKAEKADLVGVSYRLTPETRERVTGASSLNICGRKEDKLGIGGLSIGELTHFVNKGTLE
jgi:methanogenic corrinoid protein MtbC1